MVSRLPTRMFRWIAKAFQNHFHARHSRGPHPAATSKYGQGVINQSQALVLYADDDSQNGHKHGDADPERKVPIRLPVGESQRAAEPVPAALGGLGQRLVVTRRQQQQIARLVAVERRRIRGQRLVAREDAIDELGDAQRQDRVHVVPQLPFGEHPIGALTPPAELVAKAIEERIEVVVLDHEQPLVGVLAIVFLQVPRDLQPQRRLARPLLAKHHGRAGVGRVPVDLVPRRVINAGDAVFLEYRVGLRIFLGKGISADAVVFEEGLDLHEGDEGMRREMRG